MVKKSNKKTALEQKATELESQLKRALADYQNLDRRIKEEKDAILKFSSSVVLAKLLPVLDNLGKAADHLKDDGLKMVISQFREVLSSEGVEEIETKNAQFNPEMMEAVKVVEGEADNQVVEVIKPGWMIDNKPLRPAQVIVSKKDLRHDLKKRRKNEQIWRLCVRVRDRS